MKRESDLDLIKDGLLDRAEDLCQRLLPDGRFEAGRSRWMAHDPVAQDYDKTKALSVALGAGKRGRWRNFRGTAGPAKHDLIGLIAYVNQTDTKGALAWARDFLGMRKMGRDEMVRLKRDAADRAAQRQKDDERARADRIRRAQALFADGTVPLMAGGSVADHVHAYLMGRNCPVDQVPTFAADNFRVSPSTEWWNGAKWTTQNGRRRKEKAGPMFPALHAAMAAASGVRTACHVTWLDPAEPAKAPVTPPKLVYGEAAGAVIEIAYGRPDPLAFWVATRPRPVVICEGIETGLSLAVALPDVRVWAGGSITNMGNAPVGIDCVSAVIVARDNNTGNAQAQNQLDASLAKLEAHGKPLTVMASPVGDDFNDLMEGEFL